MAADHLITPQSPIRSSLCRLGLATRGDSELTEDDVVHALDRGVNFLNWPGTPDAMSRVIARLGTQRKDVAVCVQFEARSGAEARVELLRMQDELRTDYVDVLTFYYVEEQAEWDEIAGPGGALEFFRAPHRVGQARLLGLTTHQRPLAATVARSGLLDLLMIRYNAAHRGAEHEVFPIADALGLPVVVYTCLRWGGLLRPTPDDPPGFIVPRAPAWYRFALQSPSVAVALMAPNNRAELDEDLSVLELGPLLPQEYAILAAHGQRVRQHAGQFP